MVLELEVTDVNLVVNLKKRLNSRLTNCDVPFLSPKTNLNTNWLVLFPQPNQNIVLMSGGAFCGQCFRVIS